MWTKYLGSSGHGVQWTTGEQSFIPSCYCHQRHYSYLWPRCRLSSHWHLNWKPVQKCDGSADHRSESTPLDSSVKKDVLRTTSKDSLMVAGGVVPKTKTWEVASRYGSNQTWQSYCPFLNCRATELTSHLFNEYLLSILHGRPPPVLLST